MGISWRTENSFREIVDDRASLQGVKLEFTEACVTFLKKIFAMAVPDPARQLIGRRDLRIKCSNHLVIYQMSLTGNHYTTVTTITNSTGEFFRLIQNLNQ